MTDGTAIAALRQSFAQPQNQKVDGREVLLAPAGWIQIERPLKVPAPLKLTTLAGLVKYLEGALDKLIPNGAIVVCDPDNVALVGEIEDEDHDFRRQTRVLVSRLKVDPFPFDQFMEVEAFVVRLLSRFEKNESRDELQAFLASIESGSTVTLDDDGISQQVSTRRGVKTQRETLKAITLAPFRTFTDFPQPTATFTLRMQATGGTLPSVALFECDGGKWRVDAMQAIAKWLQEKVNGKIQVLA